MPKMKRVQLLHVQFCMYLLSYLQYPHLDSNLELEFETYENQGLSSSIFNTNLASEQEDIFEGAKV